jgi:hypothetical protein
MNKPEIKTAREFGNGSHIILEHEDKDKKFLVFPESSKFILKDIITDYQEMLDTIIKTPMKDFFTEKEFKTIKRLYKEKINKTDNSIQRKFLQGHLEELDTGSVLELGNILNNLEDDLPVELRKKIMKEYYRQNINNIFK